MEKKSIWTSVDRVLKCTHALKQTNKQQYNTSSGFPEYKTFRRMCRASGLININVIIENHLQEQTELPAQLQHFINAMGCLSSQHPHIGEARSPLAAKLWHFRTALDPHSCITPSVTHPSPHLNSARAIWPDVPKNVEVPNHHTPPVTPTKPQAAWSSPDPLSTYFLLPPAALLLPCSHQCPAFGCSKHFHLTSF